MAGQPVAGQPLKAGGALRAEYPADLVASASAQQELRLRARAKFSRAGEMFFHPARSGAGEFGDGGPLRPPGEFLCDPSPAVTRAGLVAELAREVGAWKIDERIAFLPSDTPLRTLFGRGLRVIDSGPWDHKRLPARPRDLDIGTVDIRRRGLAGDVDRLYRRLKLTGSRRATVVMTRAGDRPWRLIYVDAGG